MNIPSHSPSGPKFHLLQPARLRVAMVTETYPPEVNGVAMSVHRVVEGLRQRGHPLQLIRPRQGSDEAGRAGDEREQFLTRGMAIPRYAHLRMGLPCKSTLLDLWRAHRPDIVHIATEGPLGWSALRAALQLGLPVCTDFRTNFHAYSSFYGMGFLGGAIMAYLRHFHNRSHCTMVPTDAMRRTLIENGVVDPCVVARGVDTQRFTPGKRSAELRRQWQVADTGVVALHVGRLAPEKNMPTLIAAFRRLQQVRPDIRIVVVGDGPSRPELQAQFPQAIFAGFRRSDDLAAHYASSDIFVFPSLTETFGNVTPEAMASGLAVVAYDDAAARQLIEHRTHGLLATKADEQDFVEQVASIAQDDALRHRMRGQARERALTLSWDSVVQRIEETYRASMERADRTRLSLSWVEAG